MGFRIPGLGVKALGFFRELLTEVEVCSWNSDFRV